MLCLISSIAIVKISKSMFLEMKWAAILKHGYLLRATGRKVENILKYNVNVGMY